MPADRALPTASPWPPLEPAAGLACTRSGVTAFRAALATGDLAAPVAACPGWTLRDLAEHLGNVERWVVGAIVEGHPDTPQEAAPADRDALLAWYDDGAGRLLDVLATTDPDRPCWTFGPRPRTAWFWFRRQAHEHAIHVVDAQAAAGAPGPIDPALALDGVDEVVTVFFPRQVRLGRIPALARSLALVAQGDERRWVLAGDGTEGLSLADAEVRGPAEALYLLLWGRVGLGDPRLALSGDEEAAVGVLGAGLVP